MDLLLIQDLQPLFRVICLKYFISITDQIDLYKVRDLFLIIHYQDIDLFHDMSSFWIFLNTHILSYFDLFFLTFF